MSIRNLYVRSTIKTNFNHYMSRRSSTTAAVGNLEINDYFTNGAPREVPKEVPRGARKEASSEAPKTPSIPVVANLYVDPTLMSYLSIPSNLRKSRILISTKQPVTSMGTLKNLIESKFKALVDIPYRVHYKYTTDPDTVFRSSLDKSNAAQVIEEAHTLQKTLQLYITGTPGVFPPPNAEGYVLPPEDPYQTEAFTMVSFFSFHPIANPREASAELYKIWRPLKALGRVYIAKEGINAQMAIPSNVFEYFKNVTKQLPYFDQSRFNTDPAVSKEEYLKQIPFRALHIRIRPQIVTDGLPEALDWTRSGTELTPMQWHNALKSYDVKEDSTSAVTNTSQAKGEGITLFDCRNIFETDVGIFDHAEPLNTTTFRDSWVALEEALKDIPKEKPIYAYCTGGIRCVKINAFLEQKLGFTNTYRLQGGIIAYRRELENKKYAMLFENTLEESEHDSGVEKNSDSESSQDAFTSKFKGVNYVFDERIVERISDDILTNCETCGKQFDGFINCQNFACNVRFIQCPSCRGNHNDCCSKACEVEYKDEMQRRENDSLKRKSSPSSSSSKKRSLLSNRHMMTADMRSQALTEGNTNTQKTIAIQTDFENDFPTLKSHAQYLDDTTNALAAYSEAHSEHEPALLTQLRQETFQVFTHPASQRMLSDPSQGSLLSFLASMKGPNAQILELGSFTGYSALSLAMGFTAFSQKPMPVAPAAIDEYFEGSVVKEQPSSSATAGNGAMVHTCEIDEQAASIAERFFRQSSVKDQIVLNRMSAQDMITKCQAEGKKFDIVFIDADKRGYLPYLQNILGMRGNGGTSPVLLDHNEAFEHCILKEGGLIIADNTLWKGLVLHETEEWKDNAPDAKHFGTNVKRLMQVAEIMHQFNTYVANHPSLRSLLLPIRDGFTVMQYVP